MLSWKQLVVPVASAAVFALSGVGNASVIRTDEHTTMHPDGRGGGIPDNEREHAAALHAATTGSNGISYHGGPVLTTNTTIYYIWYGNWSSHGATQTVLTAFGNSIGGTPLYNVNSTYYQNNNKAQHVLNAVTLWAAQATDNYSQGASLSDAGVQAVVARAISTGALPSDPNGLYFVLTSPDVNETSGFGSQYCGWHTHGTINGADLKWSFVGDPIQIAPSGCGVNNPSPNGDGGADAMASVMFHELSETVSDPDLNAWYDRRGNENGDKCAWNFGAEQTASNGALYNQTFGGRNWLLQQMWLNANGGACVQRY